MCRFWNVAGWLLVLYLAVKVVLPGVKPVRTNDALAFWKSLPMRFSAVELSTGGGTLLAPVMANDMYPLPPAPVRMPAVTVTSTSPDAGTFTVTAGPGDAKSV